MQISARNGSVEMLEMLLQNGGAINSRGPNGDTLFHLSALNGHVEALKWLYCNGVLPEAVDMNGPIYSSNSKMFIDMITNLTGQSAVHIAARRGEAEVLRYLFNELGMDAGQLDFDGRTPLDCVPRKGNFDNEDDLKICRELINTKMIASAS